MPKSTNLFTQRLNSCLDELDAPTQMRERALVLSKLINIPKQQAWALLEGHQMPDHDFLLELAHEFEVEPEWLSGNKS